MKGYFYCDSRKAKVLHFPEVFIVVGYASGKTKVILDPTTLKRRIGILKRSRRVLRELVEVQIDDEDINAIIELQSRGNRKELGDYCIDIFDYHASKIREFNSHTLDSFSLDSSGYDSRFIQSQFDHADKI